MSTIEEQQQNISTMQVYAAQCERELAEALVDGDQAAVKTARRSLESARQAVSDAEAIVAITAEREAASKAAIRAADVAARRATVREFCTERVGYARDVERLSAELGAAIENLILSSRQIGLTSPDKLCEDAGISHDRVVGGFIVETLQRHRCLTATKSPLPFTVWELQQRPALSDRIRNANSYIETFTN